MTNPADPTTTVTPEIGLNGSVDAANLLLEVSGTTVGFADGTEVNVLIMDIMGNSTSVLATIQNGSFLIANIDASKFTPGQLTFTATANDTLAQATTTLPEIVSGDPIVITEQPVLNGQNKLTVLGKAPSLKVNDELTLVVRDTTGTSVTTTAVVQADGSFSVTGLSTQGLKDGLLSIDVMAITDSGSISVVNAASVTMTNLTPLGSDKALQATEDIGLVITAADFGYSNTDGFSMTGVKIAGLPSLGTLKLNGVAVVEDQFVSMAQLSAGQLVFQAATNANGSNYANFKFKVLDNRPVNNEDLVANTITLNVAAVNDAPVVTTAGAITAVNEDSASATATTLWSTAPAYGQGGGSDESSQTLTYKITAIPTFITLFKADGTTAVTAGTTVTATEFAALKYKTVADANGTGNVTFDVIDSGSGTTPNVNTLSSQSVSMTVNAVNDAPVVTTAGAITAVNEDSASATATTLWSTAPAYSTGPSDEGSQTLTYKITAIPTFITLFKADGTTAVTAGTTVTATEFAALKYKTVADANGTGNVTFDVIDSGSSTTPNVNTLSSQSVSMTVNAVNDAPVVTTAGAITAVNEDSASATATTLWSTAPAYGQGGGSDESSQTLTYKITAIPTFITLFKADGTTAVTAGTTVTATEFAALKYKTVADANGTGNVTFDVIDSGSSTAPNVNTLSSQSVSMTVNAVNDAPVVTTAGAITAVNEDSASATATTLWSTAPAYSTGPSDESSQTLTYKITAIPTFITLFKADGTTAVTAGTTVTATEFAALKYKTVADANGTGNVTFDVIDSGSSTAPNVNTLSSQSVSMTVNAVNDAPVVTTAGAITAVNEDSASATATTLWSTAPAYSTGPSDEGSQTLTYKITAIPTFITLFKADGTTAVTAGTTVTAIEFAALKYKTVGNANGTGNVTFDVIDSGSGTTPNVNTLSSQSVSMTVNAVNDAPVVTTAGAITAVNEDSASATATTLWSTAPAYGQGGGSDESSQTLTYKITAIPTFITLFKADGTTAVTAGTTVTATEFAALKYKTVADANGTGNVTFDVIDSGSSTTPNVNTLSSQSVSMTVNAVNDAPTSANATFTVLEDGSKTFSAADFAFADTSDSPVNSLSKIVITALPAAGTLKLSGTAVTVNQAIALADVGNLVYAPAANGNGSAYATFGFKVQDNGGTTNGGVDTSTTANTITINVTAVNDAPVLANTVLDLSAVIQGSATPVGAVGVLVSSLVGGVTDVDASAEKGMAITGFNSAKGQLFFSTNGGTNWTEITSASEASARLLKADTDNRVYFKAAAGTQGTVADALTFRAWDGTTGTDGQTGDASVNGGTAAFSTATDTVSEYVVAPVTINVVSTDDLINVREPLLITGKADPNAVVTLNINSQNFNVTANATGDWSYDGSKVRYVMVRKSLMNLPNTDPDYNLKGILTIGEVEIYERTTGQNASTWTGVTQSYSNASTFTTGSLRDMNSYYTAGNYVETSGSQMGLAAGVSQDAWVQIDLGAAYSLADIKLVGAQNTNARMNGAMIYTSATDMSTLTKAQLDSSVLVNKSAPVTGLTNVGWQGFNATADAIYGNALNEGANTVTASELVQGVSSQASRVVTLDSIAPVTTVTSAALSSDTGTSNTDFITSVAAQTITGNLSANLATGEKVMVSMDNGVTWTAATAAVGTSTWSLSGVTLSGTNTLQAKVVDTAGNGSTPYTKVYALVTVSDLTVGITQIDDNAGTASTVFSNGTTNDTTPKLTGSLGGATQGAALAANEVVNVYRTPNLATATVVQGGSLAGSQILSGNALTHYFNGDGNYGSGNVYLPTTPANGDMVVITKGSGWGLEVYAGTTLVGNLGGVGFQSGGQDNLYFKWDAAKSQWLTGTNALIKVGTAAVTTIASNQSTWTLTDNTGLGNSDSVNYIAQVENTAGTFGRQSTPGVFDWRYNVDNVAPSSITLIGTDDVGPVTGTIAANSVTNDDKPTFSGTTEGNAVVSVYDGATLLGTTTANGSGAWSFTPTTAMATGAHSVQATATDAYGNTTPKTTALPFSIDTTAPVAVADTNSGTEDAASVTGTVATNDTSKDGSETFALVGSGTGTKGTLVINTNGSYTYTRTSSADEITADLVETFTYKITDAAGNTSQSTLKITLTPVNDAATFTGDLTKAITETNAAQTVSGTLTVADVDSATTVTAQTDVAGSAGYGKFTISTAGVWSYVMDSAQNQFVASQTYDDTLTVTTADGTQQVIKVTITGTNDTPTVVSSTSSTGKVFFTENGAPVLARGGTITLADAEQVNLQSATVRVVDMTSGTPVTGDTLTFTVPSGSGITSSFDAVTGTMTFTGSATQAQYQALFDSVKFSNARNDLAGGGRNVYYAVKDGSGVSSTEALTRVDVLRLNDAPVLDNTTNLSLTGIAPTAGEIPPTGAVGVLVSTLVGGVTDADLKLTTGADVPQGIAIVGANSALGKVYFSVSTGPTYTWFTPSFDITDTAALLLKADASTRVYFRPNAGVEGTIANALTIRAWDTTDNKSSLNGSNVVQHNVSTTLGGTNAYSVAVDTVSLSVATVASAPGFNGTTGNDTQTGTAANEVFLGNGGADVITAGAGNDKVVLNASNVTALSAVNTANINGGTGINTLKLIGTELTLDLTNATVQGKLDGFSTVDMTSNVNNLLKLNLLNVQTFSGATDNAATTGVDESQMMVVLSDAGDAVALQDAATWSVLNGLKGTDLATLYGADYGFSSTRQYTQYSKSGATLFVDELAPVGDIVGTSGTDTLTGTANADVIYGNGGVDTIAAGAGKDTVILSASSLTALAATTNTATVNGGTDINTLKLSGINLNLDLTNTTVMGKLDNFTVIDMKQGSGNKFKLGLTEVLALAGGTDNAATVGVDESKMLVLQGNGGVAYNSLQLVDSVNWTAVTNLGGTSLQTTYGTSYGFEAGRSYTQYTSATGSANLFVDQTLLHTLL